MFVKEQDPATTISRKKSLRRLVGGILVCALWLPSAAAVAIDAEPAPSDVIIVEPHDSSVPGDQSPIEIDVEPAPGDESSVETEDGGDDAVVVPGPTAVPSPTTIPSTDSTTDVDVAEPSVETAAKEIVEFNDEKLKACVASALAVGIDADISKADLRKVTELSCELSKKPDIEPLKYATNLKRLDLNNNKISDISVLEALVKLTWLDISGNQISDFSALKALTKLEYVKIDSQKPSGSLLKDRWVDAGGTWYYLNSKGKTATAWALIGGKWYYFNAQGAMQTNWVKVGSSWYYLDTSGAMATGWAKIDKKWYYLDASGAMKTGWLSQGKTWYYFNSSGSMVTGWANVGGTWYHFTTGGAMATGWEKVSGSWYYFNASGAMATGWLAKGGTWYYLRPSGAMATGWLQQGNVWYYFKSSGAMATGRQTIGGVTYYFNSSGIWLSDQIPLFVYGTLRTGEEAEFVISGYVRNKVVTRASAVDLWITWDNRGSWPWIMPGTYGTTGEALSFAPQQASQALARADSWEGYVPGGNINHMNYTRELISSGHGYVYAYVATPHRQTFIRAYGTRVIHGDFTRF